MVLNLVTETLILAVGMAIFCVLPLVSERVRAHSKTLFLIGTGAMFGLCFFDLLPDVFELGGRSSLYVAGAVWAVYSVLHIFHIGHHHGHEHEGEVHETSHTPYLFLASIIGHCFASGMLLAASQSLSARIASTVFIALIAHKGYESLTVSSVLLRQVRSKAGRVAAIAIYSLALPMGVVVTSFFREQMSQEIAVFISSLAIGTLLGCLIFDFLLPSIHELKARRSQVGWLLLGLGITQLMMKNL